MSAADELGPPPAPKPAKMPPMTEADKKKLDVSNGGGGGGGAMPMMGSPMMGAPMMGTPMMAGCPTVGGMGPNLVFNFYQPYGMAMAAPGGGGGGDEKAEESKKDNKPPPLVQGPPTWCQPRMVTKVGQKPKDPPCVVM